MVSRIGRFDRHCNNIMKTGLLPSGFASSGDSRVGRRDGEWVHVCICTAAFLIISSYVMTRSNVHIDRGNNVTTDAETAVPSFPSGGGFSNTYLVSSCQTVKRSRLPIDFRQDPSVCVLQGHAQRHEFRSACVSFSC